MRCWSLLSAEQWLLVVLVAVAFVAHAVNMFDFVPTGSKDDEGIYTAQAWAVLREFRLTPYTYWYDHAPAGWILLAAWMWITGGPLAFGQALDSGRVFMLVLHVASVVMLYRAARKLGCGIGAATLGCLLFGVSPLAVFYGRLVLLDNIMVFWLLLSLDLLLDGDGRLSRLALSGCEFRTRLPEQRDGRCPGASAPDPGPSAASVTSRGIWAGELAGAGIPRAQLVSAVRGTEE